jgi:hypothetical protein
MRGARAVTSIAVDGRALRAFRAPVAALCRDLPLSAEGRTLLAEELSPGHALARLCQSGLHADATLFLAHALDAVDAIWWGLVCALIVEDVRPDPAVGSALEVVGEWTLSPMPELQEEARLVAHELDVAPPAAWVALAVSLLRPPDDPDAPKHRLAATYAIAASVQIGATMAPSQAAGAHRTNLEVFLQRGFDIAGGGDGGVDRLDPPLFAGRRRLARVPRPWLEEA